MPECCDSSAAIDWGRALIAQNKKPGSYQPYEPGLLCGHPQPCVAPRHFRSKRRLTCAPPLLKGRRVQAEKPVGHPTTQFKLKHRPLRAAPPIVCESNVFLSVRYRTFRVPSTIHDPQLLLKGAATDFGGYPVRSLEILWKKVEMSSLIHSCAGICIGNGAIRHKNFRFVKSEFFHPAGPAI